MRWLIYGAYGYTGRLIVREAVDRGMRPVVAGRDRKSTEELGRALGLDSRVFPLNDPEEVRRGIADVDLVLHAAGPYSRTFHPMVEACLDEGCHYLDITGELQVLEAAHRLDGRAGEAGVLLIPAVGLDVVPTDCAAGRAVERIPGALRLDLALHSSGGPSRGTARTMVERMGEPGKVRDKGQIVDVPQASILRPIPFSDGERLGVCIPWGDVSTAYHSTGIPNIRVFMTFPPRAVRRLRLLSSVLRVPGLSRLASWMVKRTVSGPSEEERREGRVRIWCEAEGAAGDRVELELTTPNGYTFTARSAVSAVERIRDDCGAPPGFHTPSSAFGVGFVDEIRGVEWVKRGESG